jgi:Fe-S-cluster containining protein
MEKETLAKLLEDIKSLPKLAKKSEPAIKAGFIKIKKIKPKDLDSFVQQKDSEYFAHIDCLNCGNCCRSLGPRITEADIDKLCKALKIKSKDFIEKYLRVDEDSDFVFKSMPCPFLAEDNYCMVYENRPKACREYPHTTNRKFINLLDISLKNRETCPIIYKISEDIVERYT